MSQPFDATTKFLVESRPADWLRFLGLIVTDVEVIDADLATLTADADRVFRINREAPSIVNLELQSGYLHDLDARTLMYSAVLHRRHLLPVKSIVLLLRRAADGPGITGRVRYADADFRMDFHYKVVRLWKIPVETLLAGELGTLPLAPLAAVSRSRLAEVIARMKARISQEASAAQAATLWTGTYVLMGLRYSSALTDKLLEGVREMEESVTYQAIIARGEARGEVRGKAEMARAILMRLGARRLGAPDVKTLAMLDAITSVDRLEFLAENVLDVENWAELLAIPQTE